MKSRLFTAIAFSAMALFSCNEDTGMIGSSLTNESDKLNITTGVYQATTRSILADSIYARNYDCYFGRVKDPETGTYVTSEFMAQFNLLENYPMPEKDQILSKAEDGNIKADSCEIWLFLDRDLCYGDSLTPIKVRMLELNSYTDSIRNLSGYREVARIPLNDPYTDKNGKTYDSYGTYILRSYYESKEYFKNSYTFINHVCPGFFFQFNDGLGVMAKLDDIELRVYYHFKKSEPSDTAVYYSAMRMASTEEVLQTTKVTNDKEGLNRLIADESCTYLKTPAGIFTEMTLPVEDIMSQEHRNDSLLSVSLTLKHINSSMPQNKYLLDEPSSVLMIVKDSLYSFFEKEKTYDYTSAFVTDLAYNSYTFSNIGNLIHLMYQQKFVGELIDPEWEKKHPNWNKVVIVPISSNTNISVTTSASIISALSNEMGLSSTQLVGGPNNPIEVKVIYAKFNDR